MAAEHSSEYTGLYTTILVLCLTTATGIIVFFIKRYIDQNDEHHKGVDKKLTSLKDDLDDHKEKMELAQSAMSRHASDMKNTAADIREDAAKFQSDINSEILKVHKATTDVIGDMNTIKKDVKELHSVAEAHQKSLSMGAQAMVKLRSEVLDIKTKITQIGHDKVLVGQEQKKKDPSDKE